MILLFEYGFQSAHQFAPNALLTISGLYRRAGEIDDDNLLFRERAGHFYDMGDGVGHSARNDTFQTAEQLKSFEGFFIGDAGISRPAAVFEEAVFRADTGIVQTGRNTVCFQNLAVFILQYVGFRAVQHTQ